MVSTSIANDGDTKSGAVEASIKLPTGLMFAAPQGGGGGSTAALRSQPRISQFLSYVSSGEFAAGDWTCSLNGDRTVATCIVDDLDPKQTAALELAVVIDTFGLSEDAKTVFHVEAGDVNATYEAPTGLESTDDNLNIAFAARGGVAATTVGAPLMGCDLATATCQTAMLSTKSTAANNSQKMIPLNRNGGERNSATTRLNLPAGANVLYAALEWSANANVKDALRPQAVVDDFVPGTNDYTDDYKATWFDAPLTSARIKAPGAADWTDIDGAVVSPVYLDSSKRAYYQSRANVTELGRQYGDGDWSVADIALARATEDRDQTYYGGFALTVIYEAPGLPTARVAMFDGSRWVSQSASAEFSFYTGSTSAVDMSWVAWDSDRNNVGDSATIDGTALMPMRWDGRVGKYISKDSDPSILGKTNDAADATAAGSAFSNSLGVDAKSFFPHADLAAGKHTLRATSSGDNYLLSSVTVTVTSAN